jgi:hypothetical protein
MPHAVIEQTFLAQSRGQHVAQAVEHKKHPAIFKNAGPVIRRGRGGCYVVLGVGDSASIQFNTPSSTEIEADVG